MSRPIPSQTDNRQIHLGRDSIDTERLTLDQRRRLAILLEAGDPAKVPATKLATVG